MGRRILAGVVVLSTLAPLSLGGGGCGRGASDRADGAPGGDAPPLFAVSGYVVGLGGGEVTLVSGPDRVTVATDGAFTFPERLPDGATYAVAVGSSPVGRLCTVANGTGAIAGSDVVDVAVTCLATDATLRSLSIAPGALSPAFAPDVTSYTTATFHSYDTA